MCHKGEEGDPWPPEMGVHQGRGGWMMLKLFSRPRPPRCQIVYFTNFLAFSKAPSKRDRLLFL